MNACLARSLGHKCRVLPPYLRTRADYAPGPPAHVNGCAPKLQELLGALLPSPKLVQPTQPCWQQHPERKDPRISCYGSHPRYPLKEGGLTLLVLLSQPFNLYSCCT